jgi:hypothetical protein
MARLKREDANKNLIDTIGESIANGVLKDLICEVSAPVKMAASKGSKFRTVPVNGGTEMTLLEIRPHAQVEKNGKLIFSFKPVDPNDEYDRYELDDGKVFSTFPDLEGVVIRVLGFDAVDTDDIPVAFSNVKRQFSSEIEARQRQIEADEKKAAQEVKKVEEKRAKNHYDNHPLYGTWG